MSQLSENLKNVSAVAGTELKVEDYLQKVSGGEPPKDKIICLFLTHNEGALLKDFVRYYRGFGSIHFIAIDDHSDDGSFEFLKKQKDVTLFRPVKGSTYKAHKRFWRASLLDRFSFDCWCLVLDVDERLVWHDMENRPFSRLLADLEKEGAEALFCTMVDMYADKPIAEHIYRGSDLLEQFPYFDSADPALGNYRIVRTPSKFRKSWNCPPWQAQGGMRDRVFFGGLKGYLLPGRWLFYSHRFDHIHPFGAPGGLLTAFSAFVRSLASKPLKKKLNLTKIGLIKWRPGSLFNGGPHYVRPAHRLSKERGVLMHFAITDGLKKIDYLTKRGEHADGGYYYSAIADQPQSAALNPVYEHSVRFCSSGDFGQLLCGSHV